MTKPAPQRAAGRRSAQVREELTRRIEDGRLPGGTRLPSEPELAAEFNVSRATLREALQAMASDGVVRRRRGAGTFVVGRPRMVNGLDLNFGVTQAIRGAGMHPGTREARHRVEPATADNAEKLGVTPGSSLVVVDRIRTADGDPVVASRDVFARDLLGDRAEDAIRAILEGSIYDVFEHTLGVKMGYGVASLRPIRADSELADKLEVERGEILLYLWQVDYTTDDQPVLLSHEYHLADAFEFSLIRRGPEARGSS